MSRGDFGYGANVREYRDNPNAADYRDNPVPWGSMPQGYQGSGRQKSGYGDFNEVTDLISSNIFKINNNATVLDRAMRQIGTPKDSVQLRDRIHSTEQDTNSVITMTTKSFKHLSILCRSAKRAQKLLFERLRSEFQETVQRYHTLQRNVAEKVKGTAVLPPQASTGSLITWQDNDDDKEALLAREQERREQMQAQTQILESDVALMHEREDRVRQLESDILDINEIFKDLGALVHEQGEMIDTIEANVEKAHDDVEAGNQQLVQASKYQKKYRKKLCICMIVLVVIAGVLALIIYLSVRK